MKKSIICFLSIITFMFLPVIMSASAFAVATTDEVYANSNLKSKTLVSSQALPKLSAKSAYLIEYNSGNVIFEKNADDRLPIASMTKLAALAVIFDYMEKGIIKESDIVSVSDTAADVGGSSAFLDSGSRYTVTDLIKTVIIASANDSTVALAEHVAGSEDGFVSKMNAFAASLKLENTHFENSTGLPHDNHYSSAKDITCIYQYMCNNSLYKKYSKIWIDDFIHPSGRKTGLVNTNRLVKTYDGIEGGKTGYTDAAKFCLTASAKRGDMRLVGVVIGVDDSKTRFKEMSSLFDYGFANYQNKVVWSHEIPVTIAKFKNAKEQVQVYIEKDIVKFSPKTENAEYTTDYQLFELKAPLSAGDVVGKMFVFDQNNMVVDEVELIIKSHVRQIGFKETLHQIIQAW